jgi:predicted DsbA family dithiol-disulfide isomerase
VKKATVVTAQNNDVPTKIGAGAQILRRIGRALAVAVLLGSVLIGAASSAVAQSLSAKLDTAKATVVVFAAFGCSYCAKSASQLRQLQQRFPGSLAIEFRHLPLSAKEADLLPHLAAIAAHEQGKFVEFYDAMFAGNAVIRTKAELMQLADLLALDLNQFSADLSSAKTRARLMSDIHSAQGYGVKVTPTLFVQGFKFEGVQSDSVLIPIIEDAIGKSAPTRTLNNDLETAK